MNITSLPGVESCSTAAADGPKVQVKSEIRANIELGVRHGARLLIRDVYWKLSEEEMDYNVIVNVILKAMGIDNNVLIGTVMDRKNLVVNAQQPLSHEEGGDHKEAAASVASGVIYILLNTKYQETGTLHCEGGLEDEKVENSDVYIALGEDASGEVNRALAAAVEEAKRNRLSQNGASRLVGLLNEYKNVFSVRLGVS